MFRITKEWLHAYPQTLPAGWTKRQLALIGVNWPPKHGWLEGSVGKEIPDTARAEFESFATAKLNMSEEELRDREELLQRPKKALVHEILELRRKLKS